MNTNNMRNYNIAIDANEANVAHRVGSNTYAFEILWSLYELTAKRKSVAITVLLSSKKQSDLPPQRNNWHYVVITPQKFWTQWALPLHLFLHRKRYQVFFTFSHYAPRLSSVPYVSSVMDLAFLHYPDQFKTSDLLKLREWTAYSVRSARKIITISQFSKQEIMKHYGREAKDIIVGYPAFAFDKHTNPESAQDFFKHHKIQKNYFLYLGTLQPRKNIAGLVAAYEAFVRKFAARNLKQTTRQAMRYPQLVIVGKLGWLTEPIIQRIQASPVKEHIIVTGFAPNTLKRSLYQHALASLLISQYEGFGIPPLESMQAGTIPIVAKNSSLPEVVGSAGIVVNGQNDQEVAEALWRVYAMNHKEKNKYKTAMKRQASRFSWKQSARTILDTLEHV